MLSPGHSNRKHIIINIIVNIAAVDLVSLLSTTSQSRLKYYYERSELLIYDDGKKKVRKKRVREKTSAVADQSCNY